jgi:hypothetical protein
MAGPPAVTEMRLEPVPLPVSDVDRAERSMSRLASGTCTTPWPAAIGSTSCGPATLSPSSGLRGWTSPCEGIGTTQGVGQPVPAGHPPDQVCRVGCGHPGRVTNNGRPEDPRTTGTAWLAARKCDLTTAITGIPNSARAWAPRPGRPRGSRSA